RKPLGQEGACPERTRMGLAAPRAWLGVASTSATRLGCGRLMLNLVNRRQAVSPKPEVQRKECSRFHASQSLCHSPDHTARTTRDHDIPPSEELLFYHRRQTSSPR